MKVGVRHSALAQLWVLVAVAASAACAQKSSDLSPLMRAPEQEQTMDPSRLSLQESFEGLLRSRNDAYESRRLALFADPAGIGYLETRSKDPDLVTAFVAKHLHLWATRKPQEIFELEAFLREGIFAKKEQQSRTAGGWQPGRELAAYLAEKGQPPLAYDHLLLRMLMRPANSGAESYATSAYYATYAVPAPEVWIRIAIERGDDASLERVAAYSLPLVERKRAIAALNHERARLTLDKKVLPARLEKLRSALTAGIPVP
jgi:hypothetical protein